MLRSVLRDAVSAGLHLSKQRHLVYFEQFLRIYQGILQLVCFTMVLIGRYNNNLLFGGDIEDIWMSIFPARQRGPRANIVHPAGVNITIFLSQA